MDPSGASAVDQLIGQTVGNYRVTQKLGEGGMGSVYLAEHPTIGKKVALKVLHAEFSTNPEVAERFFTEAKAVNAIGHPNIVDIVDYGVIQAGQDGRDRLVYFIMEYLNGTTLAQNLLTQAPMPPERALTISLQVADALAASHKTQIVHRDLKPDNIILINRGREQDFVKLLDFGIAKLTGNDGMSSHKTRTGLVLGTPAYMSPEQCEGRATVDHRTDIYALGVVLYEMLTGRVPFIGSGYGEILVQHLTQQPVPPSQYRMMSPHVEQIVLKALEKRPEMRYPTMDEFMRAMADPVGYVESHGGLTGFLGKQLLPSTSSTPVPLRLTPAPLTMATPVPGAPPMTGMHVTPAPGSLTTPTTLGGSSGQVQPAKSKAPFIIAGAATMLAAAVAVFFVLKGNKHHDNTSANAGTGSSEVAKTGSGSAQTPLPDPPPRTGSGSAVAANTGSAGSAAVVTNPATGSAGSAAGTPATGSNTAPNTGSGDMTVNAMTKVTINSTPEGADVYVNGMSVNKKTPTELTLKRELMKVSLRMKGFDEYKKDVTPAGESMSIDVSLKKAAAVAPTQGKGSGSGKGKGKGTGKSCDTCLERPD